jgi:hypothetical protein
MRSRELKSKAMLEGNRPSHNGREDSFASQTSRPADHDGLGKSGTHRHFIQLMGPAPAHAILVKAACCCGRHPHPNLMARSPG